MVSAVTMSSFLYCRVVVESLLIKSSLLCGEFTRNQSPFCKRL